MTNVNLRTLRKMLVFLTGVLALFSVTMCAPMERVKTASKTPFKGQKILVMPVKNVSRLYGENKSVISPLSGKYFLTGPVKQGFDGFFTDELVKFIKSRPNYICIPPDLAEGETSRALADKNVVLWDRQYHAGVGQRIKADAVLTGLIYRFQERVGTRHSIDTPASVAFEIHLISSTDGAIIWSGFFDETQQSLSENLLKIQNFIKRKGRWVTAEEMAVSGLSDLLRTFPDD